MHNGSAAKQSLEQDREHCSAAVMDCFSGAAFCAYATDATQTNAMTPSILLIIAPRLID